MREIVLDTETTGLEPELGHRVVEIGCVELINHLPTGAFRQYYINPQRDMPQEAFEVHGLSEEFLRDKPVFAAVVDDFLAFLGDARLIIHNAAFDLKFLNAELGALNRPPIAGDRAVDTVQLARRKFPGERASLDVLCKRFGIDLSRRSKHGALLDAELLAEVYLELIGGRQTALGLAVEVVEAEVTIAASRTVRPPRPHAPTAAELAAHQAFVAERIKAAIWDR